MSDEPSADLFKAVGALLLFTIAAVGGLMPLKLQNVGSKVVSCLNTAAAGVFFASAMVHMLPESSETLSDSWGDAFPWGGFICSVGFLLILCIDQAVSISNADRKKGHTLVPTEPPDAERTSKRLLSRGRHRNTESADYAELEMSGISPRALLSPMTPSDIPERMEDNIGSGLKHSQDPDGDSSLHILGDSGARGNGSGRRDWRASSGECSDAGHAHGPGNGGNGNGEGGGGGRNSSSNGGGGGGVGGHHTGHSHGLGEAGDGVWVRLALLLALSVHSVMEGLGVGAKPTKAYNLLFAIGIHKGLAAYALGASLLQTGVKGRELTVYVMAFSAMTPAGILLGDLIEKDGEDDTAGSVCVALASGTFLYVSLMEVLPLELRTTEHGWPKMASLLAGFAVSAVVGWLIG